jgi:hypothetical protein
MVALVAALAPLTTGSARAENSGPWSLQYREDFQQDAAVGQFPGEAYGSRWTVYPDGWKDTSKKGEYAPSRTLSVADGALTFDLHDEDGTYLGAAALPKVDAGGVYGKYAVRFRATSRAHGYGLAFLLWPDSEKWPSDGEIDFPEGELTGSITAAAHHADPRGTTDHFDTHARFGDWHTATIEWTPGLVRFVLDDIEVGRSTTGVPSRPMHWVLQAGTNGGDLPPIGAHALIQVDWVTAYAWSGAP